MNHIEMRYSIFSHRAELDINGEPVSPYSEISSLLTRPFPETISRILQGLDKEVFDNYEFHFYGSEFQYEMLESFYGESIYCKKITYHTENTLFSVEETLQRLLGICNQHAINIIEPERITVFFSDIESDYSNVPQGFSVVQEPYADIGIFEEGCEIPNTFKTVIILDQKNSIQLSGNRSIYHIKRNQISLFWDFYKTESFFIPVLSECLSALKYTKLDVVEQIELDAIKNNKPAYYIGDVPDTIDQGERVTVKFECFPLNSFVMTSDNQQSLTLENKMIIANQPGTYSLKVNDETGNNFFSKEITIIAHQYAEQIRLVPRFEYLKQNERSQIDVIVTPYNAEDINNLQWENSNPQIIHVDNSGNIVAIKHGKSIITVSGKKTSVSIEIEVKPGLQGLRFTQQSIRLKCGESVVLDCDVLPTDAPTENLTWEIDNKTIASINPSKTRKRCQVIASTNYEGKGNVRCYDTESKMGAICNIEVVSKVKMGAAGKIALICWLVGIFMPYILPVSTIASFYGLTKDQETDHHMRYIVCAIGSIITLIFWIAMAFGQ